MGTYGCQLVNGRRVAPCAFSVDSGLSGHCRTELDQGVAAAASRRRSRDCDHRAARPVSPRYIAARTRAEGVGCPCEQLLMGEPVREMLGRRQELARMLRNRMKTLLGLAALGAAAAIGLGATLGFSAASSAASLSGPQILPWGFDLAGRDLTVAPGADFYAHANGTYVRKLVIPPERARYGAFDALQALSETRVHGILEKAAANADATGDERKIGAFYRSFLDEGRANALGAKPIAPELAAIRAADSREKLAALMGEGVKGFYGSIFDVDISVDAKDPAHYAVEMGQSGLGLPNRDYYLEPAFA